MQYNHLVRIAQPLSPYLRPGNKCVLTGLEPGDFFCAQSRETFGDEIEIIITNFCSLYMMTKKYEPCLGATETVPECAAHFEFTDRTDTCDIGAGVSVTQHTLYHILLLDRPYSVLLPNRYGVHKFLRATLAKDICVTSRKKKTRKSGEFYEWRVSGGPNQENV